MIQICSFEENHIPVMTKAFGISPWNKPASIFEQYWLEQQTNERCVWLAFLDEVFSGYITLKWHSAYQPFFDQQIPEIMDLNVLLPYRKCSIATQLLDLAEITAMQRSTQVGLGVGLYADYGSAQKLYLKRGYQPDGLGVTYYYKHVNPGENVCVDDDLILWFIKQPKKETNLQGGRSQIVRIGNCVHRPSGFWTPKIHQLLHHLRNNRFFSAPKPLGFDEQGREILSFIEGEVSNYPLTVKASSIKALMSAGKMLKHYHDASQSIFSDKTLCDENGWQLSCPYPKEVVCHGDFAPYNVVLDDVEAVGMIDFDTAHPGSRLWDIAYALYRWAPFTHPDNKNGFGSIDDQIKRARIFCEAYGLPKKEREKIPAIMLDRLQSLVNFMFNQAKQGDQTFELNIQNKHHLLYLADIKYIKSHDIEIEKGLTALF